MPRVTFTRALFSPLLAPGSTHFYPYPPSCSHSTRYPDNAHTHASLNETEKKKEGRKIGFESGWKQFAMYIYIYIQTIGGRNVTQRCRGRFVLRFINNDVYYSFFFFFKRGEDRLSGVRLMDTQLNRYLVFRCYFNARCLRIYFFSFFNLLPSFFTHRA